MNWSPVLTGAPPAATKGSGEPSGLVLPPLFIPPVGFLLLPYVAKAELTASCIYCILVSSLYYIVKEPDTHLFYLHVYQ